MLNIFSLIAQQPTNIGTFDPPTSAFSERSGTDETGEAALENLESFISNLIGFMTVLASLFFVVYFVLGAFEWITSGGDKGKLEKARNRMLYRVVLVQAVLSVAVGFAIGLAFTGLLAFAIARTDLNLELAITAASLVKVGLFAAIIAGLAAILPIRQVAGVDPAVVFRRGAPA